MKAGLLITGTGALIYLTSYGEYINDALITKFRNKGSQSLLPMKFPLKKRRKNTPDILSLSFRT